MKYVRQFMIILGVCLAGEALRHVLPFPVPASVYGLVLMLGLLMCGLVRLEQVSDAAHFLIEIMPLVFIPPAMAIIEHWGVFSAVAGRFLLLCVVTTVAVLAATGWTVQRTMRGSGRKEE